DKRVRASHEFVMDVHCYHHSMQLAGQLEQLILQLVPQLSSSEDHPKVSRLLQFAMRVLSSRMACVALAPATQSAELARRRLVQAGRASDALAFSDLLQRLQRGTHGLTNMPTILQLLVALMNSQPQSSLEVCAGAALLSRPLGSSTAPALRMDLAAVVIPDPKAMPVDPVADPVRHNQHDPGRPARSSGSPESLNEAVLVRELLFVMQNIDGAYIKWDASADAFVLPKGITLPAGARQMVGRLSELGWLYRQVHSYIYEKAGAGLVPQSFRHALQAKLTEWFQLIAVLETQRQSELTLLQLLVWSHQPLQRLITLVQLVRSCGSLKGGSMSVSLARYERHGDPEVSGYVRHLLRQTCQPLMAMVKQWVLRGELIDPHDEFFIEQRAVPLEELWGKCYNLRDAMLPSFVSKPLAHKILLVGKGVRLSSTGVRKSWRPLWNERLCVQMRIYCD
ncbi:MAG: hypothetical protein SGPRY_007099, partial [Prymnesium sp.]